jgi:predicted DNA-binding transcriptional regulator AlpA
MDMEPMMDSKELAAVLGVHPFTVKRYRMEGKPLPPFVRIGRKVRYLRRDVDAWIELQKNLPQPQTGSAPRN